MIELFSPAKINLFFKLVSKRTDGFHNLQSFFQAIDLGDDMSIEKSTEDQFDFSDISLPKDDSNFIIKALNLFRAKTQISDPVKITLEKRIPVQAGLGGGSSNGSTTLWGLNELFKQPLSIDEMKKISIDISADSPFFFSSGSAFCEGRGDIIKDVKPFDKPNAWLIVPNFGLSTKEVYKYSSSYIKPNVKSLMDGIYAQKPLLENDLERAALLLEPRLAILKDKIVSQGYSTVIMTGSGSGLVCFGKSKPKCEKGIQIFPIQYIKRSSSKWYSPEVKHAVV